MRLYAAFVICLDILFENARPARPRMVAVRAASTNVYNEGSSVGILCAVYSFVLFPFPPGPLKCEKIPVTDRSFHLLDTASMYGRACDNVSDVGNSIQRVP